jgi:ABC-type branched-subunit amino acid transport system ATPase component
LQGEIVKVGGFAKTQVIAQTQAMLNASHVASNALLECHAVARSFYGVEALRGADLTVEPRRITGLIGPNGAGKTTLFNCISGLVPANAGRIVLDGQDITRWRPDQISGAGLVRTFQIARGIPRLTVLENLLLYGPRQPGEGLAVALLRPRAMLARESVLYERALKIATRLNLARVLHTPAAALSGGQKKLLEIGRALMAEPRLLLLDEPVAGVNPTLAREIGEHLRALVAEGITILLIEHQMDTISRLCDHVVVMAEGRRLIEGTFAAVAADVSVQEAYMGRRRWAS